MRQRFKVLTASSVGWLVFAMIGATLAKAESREFRQLASEALLNMEGVWHSRGYGWWWVVRNGRITSYDAGAGYCRRRRQHWGLPGHAGDNLLLSANSRTIRLALGDTTYWHTFDKVQSLPSPCHESQGDNPVAVFDAAVSILSQHYAFFEQRGVDWTQHVKSRRRRVHDGIGEAQLFTELASLIKPIDDGHIGIEAQLDGRRRQYEPPRKPRPLPDIVRQRRQRIGYWTRGIGPELVGDEIVNIGDGRIKFGLIDGDVGYLHVGSTGRSLRRALNGPLDRAKALFRGARALIIDVSRNFGGADYVARRLASRFTRKRTLGYYKYAGDAPTAEPQAIFIKPSQDLLFEGPIIVITSASTISAAEILVMCLRALPNVTHIGAATRGSLSDILDKRLPNGWELSLSNEVYLDHERTSWEGLGIKPHIAFAVEQPKWGKTKAKAAARRVINYVLELPARRRVHGKKRT